MQLKSESVVLVNEQDEVRGLAEKLYAHQEGLLHRAFSVFLFRKNPVDQKIELLLQQRSLSKYHCAGLWSNTCCSHPRYGEDIQVAALRRLSEELNITTPIALISLGFFIYKIQLGNGLCEHELDHVLIGCLRQTSPINEPANPIEVNDLKWQDWQALKGDLSKDPAQYTPWLSLAMQKVETNWKEVDKLCLEL